MPSSFRSESLASRERSFPATVARAPSSRQLSTSSALTLQRLIGNKAVADLIGNHHPASTAISRPQAIQRVRAPELPAGAGEDAESATLHILWAQIGRIEGRPRLVIFLRSKIAELVGQEKRDRSTIDNLIAVVNKEAPSEYSSMGSEQKLNEEQQGIFMAAGSNALEKLRGVDSEGIINAFRGESEGDLGIIREKFANIEEHLSLWIKHHEQRVRFNQISASGALCRGIGDNSILVLGPQAMNDDLYFTLIHEAVHGTDSIRGTDKAYFSSPHFAGVGYDDSLSNPDHYVLAVNANYQKQWPERQKEYAAIRAAAGEIAEGEVNKDALAIASAKKSIHEITQSLWKTANNAKVVYFGLSSSSDKDIKRFMRAHAKRLNLTKGFQKYQRGKLGLKQNERMGENEMNQVILRREHLQILIDFLLVLGDYCTIQPLAVGPVGGEESDILVTYPKGSPAHLRLVGVRGAEGSSLCKKFILGVIGNLSFGSDDLYDWYVILAKESGHKVPWVHSG